MSWFRKYPLFASGLTLCGLVALTELGLIYERYEASREAAQRLEQRKVEFVAMEQLAPPPTREIAAVIEADLAKAQKSLAAMQAELTGRGPAAERIAKAKVPAARTDAFFDLAAFVEKTRELAEKNGVEVRPEAARFGFSKYANEGPDTDRIEPVFRQRQIAQYLLEALLESKPRTLITVKRERTMTKAERDAVAAAEADGLPADATPSDAESESPDYFVIDPRVSARVKGFVSTTPFRFVFTAQTATLRNFLNRLASFELPVLVREVEAEPASAEESVIAAAAAEATATPAAENADAPSVLLTADSAATKAGAPKTSAVARATRERTTTPIVSKSLSKYTVTVELIELVSAAAPAQETPPAPTT